MIVWSGSYRERIKRILEGFSYQELMDHVADSVGRLDVFFMKAEAELLPRLKLLHLLSGLFVNHHLVNLEADLARLEEQRIDGRHGILLQLRCFDELHLILGLILDSKR